MANDGRDSKTGKAPATVAGDLSSDTTVISDARSRPQQLGRYALLERLGVGGMAEVYLAEQAGAAGFHKKVVVKRILPHLLADRQFVEMFAREAKVAARIAHPNVVQIFELGEEGGEFYIAMEHIDGLTLHRVAAAAWENGYGVPIDVVLRTLADAAMGLHAAHTMTDETGKPLQLVHRDVSPDNLMLSKDGVTKVLDFGIAKGDVGGPKTKTGNLRGKIPFMPPEQITGDPLDGRADLYALGVSAYWMLTGERPFDRQSDWHTMHAILNDVAKPPSSLNPAISPQLDALILQLLEKDRTKRPSTGKEVADRLEELASPGSVGGKKSTVNFLETLLPTTNQRGNPVSEVQAEPKMPISTSLAFGPPAGDAKPVLNLQAGVANTAEVLKMASPQARFPTSGPAASAAEPAPALEPLAVEAGVAGTPSSTPAPISALAPAPSPAPSPASVAQGAQGAQGAPEAPDAAASTAEPPMAAEASAPFPPPSKGANPAPINPKVASRLSQLDDQVRPVTTPAAPNAIESILAPKKKSAAPLVIIAILLIGTIVGVGFLVLRSMNGPDIPDAVVDAGVAPTPVVDAGPPPPALITVKTNAPTRIRWSHGDKVVGLGKGSVRVPEGTPILKALDTRWLVESDVPIKSGVADYDALPTGTVNLVRINTRSTKVTLGDDDVTLQRRLTLVEGRYTFVVERSGRKSEQVVVLHPGQSFTIDGNKF